MQQHQHHSIVNNFHPNNSKPICNAIDNTAEINSHRVAAAIGGRPEVGAPEEIVATNRTKTHAHAAQQRTQLITQLNGQLDCDIYAGVVPRERNGATDWGSFDLLDYFRPNPTNNTLYKGCNAERMILALFIRYESYSNQLNLNGIVWWVCVCVD